MTDKSNFAIFQFCALHYWWLRVFTVPSWRQDLLSRVMLLVGNLAWLAIIVDFRNWQSWCRQTCWMAIVCQNRPMIPVNPVCSISMLMLPKPRTVSDEVFCYSQSSARWLRRRTSAVWKTRHILSSLFRLSGSLHSCRPLQIGHSNYSFELCITMSLVLFVKLWICRSLIF